MTHRQSIALFACLLIAFLPGCDSLKGPEGPAHPVLTGDVIGFAYLRDTSLVPLADNSGITVSAEGANVSAVTDSAGRWVLSNLATGTYTLEFSKPGYGTMKMPAYRFVGGGQAWVGTMYLFRKAGYGVSGLGAYVSAGSIFISGSLTGPLPTGTKLVRLFAGPTAAVSSDPGTYLYSSAFTVTGSTFSGLMFSSSVLISSGFSYGQPAYLIAYGDNLLAYSFGGFESYLDMSTNRRWFPYLSPVPSNVVSVVLP